MENVSFTSSIVPVTQIEFGKLLAKIGKNAGYPWTIKESVVGENVSTTNIDDCTACLITDGQKAILLHLNPLNPRNHQLTTIHNYINEIFDLSRKNLQALVIGSKNFAKSENIFNNFISILNKYGIPTTELKNAKDTISIAYRTSTDEIYISSKNIDKKIFNKISHTNIFHNSFEKVKISKFDKIS